jgi:hypothetical protein
MRHTDFMQQIAQNIGGQLPSSFSHYQLGETRWYCQLYFGKESRIHYEVSRPFSRAARHIEIALHFESRDRDYNQSLLTRLDHHLLEICAELDSEVIAEIWDRGWAKVYELHPDGELTDALVQETTKRFARFISVVQPIFEFIV